MAGAQDDAQYSPQERAGYGKERAALDGIVQQRE
jgi:hypothetical protein